MFSLVDSGRNLLLSSMHTTLVMSLYPLVKHKYPKTSNIFRRAEGIGLMVIFKVSKMLNMNYSKCQKCLHVATE